METEKKSLNGISWTWADQISTYRFWGIFLFATFFLLSNLIVNRLPGLLSRDFNLSSSQIETAFNLQFIASFGGFWLAWFLIRLKNHFLLYLYAAFTIIGLLILLISPTS